MHCMNLFSCYYSITIIVVQISKLFNSQGISSRQFEVPINMVFPGIEISQL